MPAPHDGQRTGTGCNVHQQPVLSVLARAARQRRVDQAETQQVDQPGMRAGGRADLLVLLDHRPLREEHDELLLPIRRQPTRTPVHLRLVHAERDGLADLPANHPVQVRRPCGHVGEAHHRHLCRTVRKEERDAPRPAWKLVQHVVDRARHRGCVREVAALHGRRHGAVRQRRERVPANHGSPPARLHLHRRHPLRHDRHGHGRTGRREQ